LNHRDWYRKQLAALTDADLARRCLRLLRCEWLDGQTSWATGECYWECCRRGREAIYAGARRQVIQERDEHRRLNEEAIHDIRNRNLHRRTGEPD